MSFITNSSLKASLPPLVGCWTFVGDVHGRLESLPKCEHPVIQVGDMGLGFVSAQEDEKHLRCRDDLWFIRGNHDDPAACRVHPRYLGDWGRHEFMFWVSGAWSIDQDFRVEGVSWWRDEELNFEQGGRAFDDYVAARPRVMVSHDGPASLFMNDGPMELFAFRASSTATLLQTMFEAHQPEVWIFGHHHESRDFTLGSTRFCCLDVEESMTLCFDGAAIT
jgi:hypothetical protein